jgi:hypothetical protein
LQEELHTEIYPGTEIMTDVGSHHFVKAGTGTHSVLVPQPSDDEHDPLVCYFSGHHLIILLFLTSIELESLLERGYNVLRNSDFLHARHPTTLIGTHVWQLH